jgi:hypothetical protein
MRFTLGDPHEGKIEWMPFDQVERIFLSPQSDRDVFDELVKLSVRRPAFLLRDFAQIYFPHAEFLSRAANAHEQKESSN